MGNPYKVLIMRCDEYDAQKIAGIVKEGMEELGITPRGKILLKPNVVIAHPKRFPHAFTRKEFLDGVITATNEKAEDVDEVAVGERCGITLPTRWVFKNAGYPEILRKHGVKAYYFDEVRQVPVSLKQKNALRNNIFVPQPVAEADFLINLPKFKAHPWCRLTLSLKNFIGIQDDRHRLVDHNLFLEHKIADLQEVVQPRFIAIDAITAGQKMMLTPTPFAMGAIVMGTNSCAVDTVGCHMVHVDPTDIIHLKLTAERGFGPISLDDIDVGGDYPLEAVRAITGNFEFCMEPINQYFGDTGNLKCTVGTFPEQHSSDYCWGGCPGALQEAMHIYKAYYSDITRRMKKVRYVVGRVEGSLDLDPDEKVMFVGDCTSWEGRIKGEKVAIKSRYRTTSEVDEKKTKTNDMLYKTVKTLIAAYSRLRKPYSRIRGCTVSVGDHVHHLSVLGKIPNLNFDPTLIFPLNLSYWTMRFMRAFNWITGR